VLNIWNAYFGTWKGNPKYAQFPLEYVRDDHQTVSCRNREELLDAILAEYGNFESSALWRCVLLKVSPQLLFDPEIIAMLERYLYCEKFAVLPYPGTYDDQPAEWIDFVQLVQVELSKCAKSAIERAEKNG